MRVPDGCIDFKWPIVNKPSEKYSRANNGFALSLSRNRLLRMLVAGALNSIFSFIVFSGALLAGMPPWLALLVGVVCGTVFNFFTTGGYVFRHMSLRVYPRFVACYLLIYAINLTLIHLISAMTGSDIVSQAIITIPIGFLSYLLMARFVFVPQRAKGATGSARCRPPTS
jgi:putative flippase GtrA